MNFKINLFKNYFYPGFQGFFFSILFPSSFARHIKSCLKTTLLGLHLNLDIEGVPRKSFPTN